MLNTNIDDLSKRYLSGVSLNRIVQETGITIKRLRRTLVEAGIQIRPRSKPFDEPAIVALFDGGASVNGIAGTFGTSRCVIDRILRKNSRTPRSNTEANRVMMAQRAPEENARNTVAAHDAIRGVPKSEEFLRKRALGVERAVSHTSPEEHRFAELLVKRGLHITKQKAVGPYNLDIGVHEGSVAVEICGGGYGRARWLAFRERLDFLLDRQWTPVMIHVSAKHPFTLAAVDYVVALSEALRLNPPTACQEHVITGYAKPCAIGSSKVDYRAAIGGDKCGAIVRCPDTGRWKHASGV